MSDLALVNMIQQAVMAAVQPHVTGVSAAELETIVGESIRTAVTTFRSAPGSRSAYAGALGSFIIEQNPYGQFELMEFPDFPLNPNDENPWVRRSGVLSAHHAGDALAGDQPIPAGHVVNFSYSDWVHLEEDAQKLPEFDTETPITINETSGLPEIPPAFLKPPPTVAKPAGTLPPDSVSTFPHNIVKTVRLRYSFFDRRYTADSPEAQQFGRDRHTGYILICYSGSDHG